MVSCFAYTLASARPHLHVSLHQAVHAVYGPSEATQQHDHQHDDDQRRKSPAQQEVEQVPPLRVLVVHHQHLPEVHGLRAQTGRGMPVHTHFFFFFRQGNGSEAETSRRKGGDTERKLCRLKTFR